MQRAVRGFLWQQARYAAIANAVLNGLFFYLSNMRMEKIPLAGALVDTLITCGFVTCLVTWPTSHFTRKAVKAGFPAMEANPLIGVLPVKWPLLFLLLWPAMAVAMGSLVCASYWILGLDSIGFLPMLILKIVSMGVLGGGVAALVAARYLQPHAVGMTDAPAPST
ncbi:MAG: hypothetical protein GXY83_29135 [Rhodopirellula sp.]|nr:hypothetical protein [Rhodopirellula sp.]